MVTVSGNLNPTNPTYPSNPTAKYGCEFVNLNCIYTDFLHLWILFLQVIYNDILQNCFAIISKSV